MESNLLVLFTDERKVLTCFPSEHNCKNDFESET